MEDLKITIEVGELAGCTIERNGNTMQWEELERKDQIHVINSLAQFYKLFYENFKENNNENERKND